MLSDQNLFIYSIAILHPMAETLFSKGIQVLNDEGIITFAKKSLQYILTGNILYNINNIIFDLIYSNRIDIVQQDWDNLILMDACRYDYFKKTIPEIDGLNGHFRSVISQGGHSWEFMEHNFIGEELHDTIYITANPHTERLDDDIFHKIKRLYATHWNDQWETVLPSDVVECAVKTHEEHPNKRLIIHFMQPHTPFIGSTAEELNERFNIRGFDRTTGRDDIEDMRDGEHIRNLVQDDIVEKSAYHEAYTESLHIVLKKISELVDILDGQTIVSSDHGELLGERVPANFWRETHGHPHNLKTRTVYKVPWLEIESHHRRQTIAEKPNKSSGIDQTTLDDRLQALGYK
jgi:hypothetical protein